jgi:CDP-paratose 2-epimerase
LILITGSLGLVGSETSLFFLNKGYEVLGIDNNQRLSFFGKDGDNYPKLDLLKNYKNYTHCDINLLNHENLNLYLKKIITNIDCVIHTAAQPSHDWAKDNVILDWQNNATATLNLLELFRKLNKKIIFIYVSTNKVYGDHINYYDFIETETRYDLNKNHIYYDGIDENMSIDNTKHSLFGVSKLSADLITQEYGKYFNMSTVCFRCGCITGNKQSGVINHGFLSFLIKTYKENKIYNINGYKGKQVRDNLHAYDLANAFYLYYKNPKQNSNVYNLGGGRENSLSIIEIKNILNLKTNHLEKERDGDHKWWITNNTKFKKDYNWNITKNIKDILTDFDL